jgi:hypothetical protein
MLAAVDVRLLYSCGSATSSSALEAANALAAVLASTPTYRSIDA